MNTAEGNFFEQPQTLPTDFEFFQSIVSSDNITNITIERIISTGQKTPPNQWLEQDRDEWVMLLQGESELSFEDGRRKRLKAGDYLLIPKDIKHRVESTSSEPSCIWLAVYFQ